MQKSRSTLKPTSEWSAAELLLAKEVADRLHLVPPCADQTQYSMLTRGRVEVEYAPLYAKASDGGMGLGLTIWSPLASGVLTGKYAQGVPAGSRLSKESFKTRGDYKVFMKKVEQAERLRPIALKLGCSMGQLALAWCMANPNVSTTMTGATDVSQVEEQLGALPVIERLTADLMTAIDDVLGPDVLERARQPMPDAQSMRPLRTKNLSPGALAKL